MATLGLSRLLPKPSQAYQVHKDEPSPAALQRLEVYCCCMIWLGLIWE
jgi:hypothetical protein